MTPEDRVEYTIWKTRELAAALVELQNDPETSDYVRREYASIAISASVLRSVADEIIFPQPTLIAAE